MMDSAAVGGARHRHSEEPTRSISLMARGDSAGCARLLEYYGGLADKLQGAIIPLGPN